MIKKIKTTNKIVTHITNPPIRGVPTSFSLCKLLKTVASSPEIAFCHADFFQSLCLYKKFIKNGHHKMAAKEAIEAMLKILMTLKVKSVIFNYR
jgi:hypothetical protein